MKFPRIHSLHRPLPPGNGGFPRWRFIVWGRKTGLGDRVLLHIIVPRYQWCLWLEDFDA